MKESKSIDIIIPVYNTPQNLLHRCIMSVLNQTYHNIRIIIVDDGSEKDIYEYCERMETKFDNIKVIHQENLGVSSARNTGIKLSNSEYLMFLDSDDELKPNVCNELVKIIDVNSVDMVISNTDWRESYSQNIFKANVSDLINEAIFERDFSLFGTHVVWGKLIRRKFLIENDIYFNENLTMSEDVFFNICFFSKNPIVYLIDKNYLVHNVRKNSLSRNPRRNYYWKSNLLWYKLFFNFINEYKCNPDEIFMLFLYRVFDTLPMNIDSIFYHTNNSMEFKKEMINLTNNKLIIDSCYSINKGIKSNFSFWHRIVRFCVMNKKIYLLYLLICIKENKII